MSVYQAKSLGVGPGPNPALGHAVYRQGVHCAAPANHLQKAAVGLVHIGLYQQPFAVRQGAVQLAKVGIGVGANAFKPDAHLVPQEFFSRKKQSKNANGARDGGGLCKNSLPGSGNVVATRSGQIPHTHHDWLHLAQQFQFAPHHVGRQGTAPGRIDPQHHGFDPLVGTDVPQGLNHCFAGHHTVHAVAVHNVSFGIHHGQSVQRTAFFFVALCRRGLVIFKSHQGSVFPVLGFDFLQENILVRGTCHQSFAGGFFAAEQGRAVHQNIESVCGQSAVACQVGPQRAPNTAQQFRGLAAVGVGHFFCNKGFTGAFVRIVASANQLGLDPHFIQKSFEIGAAAAQSAQFHQSFGVNPDLLGCRGQVVLF